MLGVTVFWAANFIVVKAANQQIPPVTFGFLRFASASLVLLVVLRWREGSVALPRPALVQILGLGAIGFGVYQIAWATALQDIPAGDSALLVATTPVLTALLAAVNGTDVLSRAKVLGSLVSFAGVAVVIGSGAGLSLQSSLLGDGLTLAAAVCWAVYTAFGASVLRRHSPLRTTTWAMVGGSLILLLPGLWQASSWHGASWNPAAPDVAAWAGLAYSSLIPAGLSNVLVFHAIRLLGPTRITAYQFLVPFIAVVLGAAFLAEPIRFEQVVGGVVIVLGVGLTRLGRATAVAEWVRARVLPTE